MSETCDNKPPSNSNCDIELNCDGQTTSLEEPMNKEQSVLLGETDIMNEQNKELLQELDNMRKLYREALKERDNSIEQNKEQLKEKDKIIEQQKEALVEKATIIEQHKDALDIMRKQNKDVLDIMTKQNRDLLYVMREQTEVNMQEMYRRRSAIFSDVGITPPLRSLATKQKMYASQPGSSARMLMLSTEKEKQKLKTVGEVPRLPAGMTPFSSPATIQKIDSTQAVSSSRMPMFYTEKGTQKSGFIRKAPSMPGSARDVSHIPPSRVDSGIMISSRQDTGRWHGDRNLLEGSARDVSHIPPSREDSGINISSRQDTGRWHGDRNLLEGIYEVEVTWEGDSDLHARKKRCEKHPGHKEYISVNEFQERNLPPDYQHGLIVELIKCLSELTVHLKVNNISSGRPGPPYPPYPRCGADRINGSGHVSHAEVSTETDKTCPCPECVSSGTPKARWGKIYIHTAAHVVYNDKEAANTTCSFFFDTDDQDMINKISGMEHVEIDHNEDRCWMFCYTHDLSLLEKLQTKVEYYEKLQDDVRKAFSVGWYDFGKTDLKLTIIVAHPHGCGKYVSVGEFVERHEMPSDPDWTKYTYTTPTCPGSSGAPVFILGKKGWFDYHHHSGTTKDKKLNQSTYGLF